MSKFHEIYILIATASLEFVLVGLIPIFWLLLHLDTMLSKGILVRCLALEGYSHLPVHVVLNRRQLLSSSLQISVLLGDELVSVA